MKARIKNWLTQLLNLEADRANVAQLKLQGSADLKQIIELTRRMQQAEAQIAAAPDHAPRIEKLERANLPTRYISTPTGLQQI